MYRSTVYGTRDAADRLAAFARRLGYAATAVQVYGNGDHDWAMVVTGMQQIA